MDHELIKRVRWVPVFAVAGLALAACQDTETIFVEVPVEVEVPRELYTEPLPAGAANYLGYNDDALTNPTCAECHAEIGAKWKNTVHSEAWEVLQMSGEAQPSCEGCHSVSELGNAATDPGGWTGSQDERYHDVQCESCHGPGKDHVDTGTNAPLASIALPFAIDGQGNVTPGTNGCGECHSQKEQPYLEQWTLSDHAESNEKYPAQDPTRYCVGCHTAQGALARWGVTSNYVEKEWQAGDAQPLVCAVCHNPHDASNEHQLRFPVETEQITDHLCAQCHNRRPIPDAGSSHGLHPHAPEALMLAGEAGYFFPDMEIGAGDVIATHGRETNPEKCATCHVSEFEITDGGGDLLFKATGHTFQPIPCVDALGIPTDDETCELSTTARSFNGCVDAGCHGVEAAVFSAFLAATTRIQGDVLELEELLPLVDPNLDDPCVEPDVPGDPAPNTCIIDPTDGVITTAEGAFFNMELALHPTGTRVWASTAHNPFLLEILLLTSIDEVEAEYGVMAGGGGAQAVLRQQQLQDVLRRAGVR
jgi:predicted CXXCH cytochrome family protein